MLSHFPTNKQAELNLITDTLSAHPDVHFIIYFAPTEPTTSEIKTGYQLLVILKHQNIHLQNKLTDKITKAITPKRNHLKAPILNLVFHGIKDVNQKLRTGNLFFQQIKKNGLILYTSEKHKLSDKEKISSKKKRSKKIAAEHSHKLWIQGGDNFWLGYHFFLEKNLLREAVFLLHQTLESYFTAVLIHYTDHRPKEHDLNILLNRIKVCNHTLNIFPESTEFQLLCDAYTQARYHRDKITVEQLQSLEKKVSTFRELIEDIFEPLDQSTLITRIQRKQTRSL
jgi:HEPN domain-containing protein